MHRCFETVRRNFTLTIEDGVWLDRFRQKNDRRGHHFEEIVEDHQIQKSNVNPLLLLIHRSLSIFELCPNSKLYRITVMMSFPTGYHYIC